MAYTSSSVWKTHLFSHNLNYYDPLSRLANRAARVNYSFSSDPTLKFPLSTHFFDSTGRRPAAAADYLRRSPFLVNASSEKSPEIISSQSNRFSKNLIQSNHTQLLHHHLLRMVLDIVTLIWRLPGFIAGFFKKENELLDEVEEDIIKTTDVIKGGAKIIEEVAEGLEEVAEGVERVAKNIDKDAKKVDDIMDKVKERTKTAHDEIEDVVGSLQGSVENVEEDITRVQVKVKEVKEKRRSKEESNNTPNTIETPTSQDETIDIEEDVTKVQIKVNNSEEVKSSIEEDTTSIETPTSQDKIVNPFIRSTYNLHFKPYSLLDALKWVLTYVHFEPLSYMMPLSRILFGTMFMVSCVLGVGVIANKPLVSYAF